MIDLMTLTGQGVLRVACDSIDSMTLRPNESITQLLNNPMTNNILKIFPILILLFLYCSKQPTTPETGSITGKVFLEDQKDHSGISVALYKLAELDTTILRYNREYPNVGFPISQATEFACPPFFGRDHRLGEVAAEAKTKQDGSFEIDGVEEGTYNLVAEKAGFGWKYVYEVTIEKGKNKKVSELINCIGISKLSQ